MCCMKKIFAFFILFNLSIAQAASIICTPVLIKAEDKNIILPGPNQPRSAVIYFLQNRAPQSVWLDHPTGEHKGASAGWSSYIHPNHWSALVLNRKQFVINCATIKPGKVDYLDCKQIISVCTPKGLSAPKRKNTYWLVENKLWDDLLATVNK